MINQFKYEGFYNVMIGVVLVARIFMTLFGTALPIFVQKRRRVEICRACHREISRDKAKLAASKRWGQQVGKQITSKVYTASEKTKNSVKSTAGKVAGNAAGKANRWRLTESTTSRWCL